MTIFVVTNRLLVTQAYKVLINGAVAACACATCDSPIGFFVPNC